MLEWLLTNGGPLYALASAALAYFWTGRAGDRRRYARINRDHLLREVARAAFWAIERWALSPPGKGANSQAKREAWARKVFEGARALGLVLELPGGRNGRRGADWEVLEATLLEEMAGEHRSIVDKQREAVR